MSEGSREKACADSDGGAGLFTLPAAVLSGRAAVAVAVSGGADSLYALLRLHEAGVRVMALHGVFFSVGAEREAATQAVREGLEEHCRALGVDLHVLDLRAQFRQLVIRPFVEGYARGDTPNPCALCNARLKFGLLLQAALKRGAGYLATGHYAGLEQATGPGADFCPATAASSDAISGLVLLQACDPAKDQSYFLSLVPPAAMARALFPLGDTRKSQVLDALARHGITPPQPGESQDVCFIPDDAYRDYLPAMADELGVPLGGPGPMALADGRVLGRHKGLWRYTEGQRRGLGLAWTEPLYVAAKDQDLNLLRVAPAGEMRVHGCLCRDVNILLPPEHWPPAVLVKTRYREPARPARARLTMDSGAVELELRFEKALSALAPGQIATVYIPWGKDGARLRVVAGGRMVSAWR
ncbi:tRNA-specific 2-thiouridylase [Desulfovibrio sp. OttesenSCG-928-A18]|nr:tRNA-specific 2-thiouridylase [Desulfovibrio sp. OttesenSCG-928-A18]